MSPFAPATVRGHCCRSGDPPKARRATDRASHSTNSTTVNAPTVVAAATPLLSVRAVSKTFAGRRVLSDFTLDVRPGEVRALLGQNGSGKSTFIKVLAGYQPPDPGAEAMARGEEIVLPLTRGDLDRLGYAFVHQHLGLVATESVLENFLLGDLQTLAGWRISWRAERQRVARALADFGMSVRLDAAVSELSEVERAMLAIVRAVDRLRRHESGLLVLDESTAYLPRDGIDRLFAVVREVAAAGFGVLFVTHRLDEVVALASHVSVLRDGVLVADEPAVDLDETALIERILGFALDQLYPSTNHPSVHEQAIRATDLSGSGVAGIGLEVGRGEIVGITGLLGMGWEEVPYLLFGAGGGSGTVTIDGVDEDVTQLTPRRAIRRGLAMLPADRLNASGVGDATVRENLTLLTVWRHFRGGWLHLRREAKEVQATLSGFDVRPSDPDRMLGTLSGGNQQKALLAKWFGIEPRVFMLHEPTHGVDIGAKKQIFARIRAAADSGAAVLIASAEYEDLAHLCDRVLIFRDGRICDELTGSALQHERIVERCFGSQTAGAGHD